MQQFLSSNAYVFYCSESYKKKNQDQNMFPPEVELMIPKPVYQRLFYNEILVHFSNNLLKLQLQWYIKHPIIDICHTNVIYQGNRPHTMKNGSHILTVSYLSRIFVSYLSRIFMRKYFTYVTTILYSILTISAKYQQFQWMMRALPKSFFQMNSKQYE